MLYLRFGPTLPTLIYNKRERKQNGNKNIEKIYCKVGCFGQREREQLVSYLTVQAMEYTLHKSTEKHICQRSDGYSTGIYIYKWMSVCLFDANDLSNR